MATEVGAGALPAVATGFIALVFLVIVVVIVSRVIRLARGGPDADRLRQQLLLQQRTGSRSTADAAMGNQQVLLDLQQQQTVIVFTNTSMNTSPPN